VRYIMHMKKQAIVKSKRVAGKWPLFRGIYNG